MLGGGRAEQSGPALVFESEALAVDADDDRVVEDAVEHRHGEHAVAGEGGVATAEPFRDELFSLTLDRPPCYQSLMVNSQNAARSLARKAARRLTSRATDPCASRKNFFDRTKLTLDRSRPKTTRDCIFLPFSAGRASQDCAASTRNRDVMLRFWAVLRTLAIRSHLLLRL